jgi:hypothetical protein
LEKYVDLLRGDRALSPNLLTGWQHDFGHMSCIQNGWQADRCAGKTLVGAPFTKRIEHTVAADVRSLAKCDTDDSCGGEADKELQVYPPEDFVEVQSTLRFGQHYRFPVIRGRRFVEGVLVKVSSSQPLLLSE